MPRKNKSTAPAAPRPLTGPQRLNKVLAAAGLGSRRDCEQFILDGRIEVDGQPVTDLATKVDPEAAKITFDGSLLKIFRPVYIALHKPSGVLSTNFDPSGRMRAIDLVNVKERLFSVGRLDRFSEGLMLLTNDGELAQRLAHPRYGVQKLYLATVQGEVTQTDLEKLVRGVRLAEGFAKVDAVKLRRQRQGAAELEIALSEGKNREIRRILARLGHKVVGLKRLAIGSLRLGQLPVGGWRPLTREEVLALYSTTAHRKKRRGLARPSKGSPRPEGDTFDEPLAAGASAGHFHQPYDEEDDDDFGAAPIFGDDDDDMSDDDEIIALSDQSVVGTVIPYDDEEQAEHFDDEAEESLDRPRREPRGGRPPRAGKPASSDRRGGGSRSGGSRAGASRSAGSASPHDLRNRQLAGRPPRGGEPTAAPTEGFSWEAARGRASSARSAGPRAGRPASGGGSAGPRPPRSQAQGGSGGGARGSRAPSGNRTGGRPGFGRPSANKTNGSGSSRTALGSAGASGTGSGSAGARKPAAGRPAAGRTGTGKTGAGRPGAGRTGTGKPSGGNLSGGRGPSGRSTGGRSVGGAPAGGRPSAGRPASGRPSGGRPSGGKPSGGKPGGGGGSARGGPRGSGPKGKRGGGRPPGGGSGPRGKRK